MLWPDTDEARLLFLDMMLSYDRGLGYSAGWTTWCKQEVFATRCGACGGIPAENLVSRITAGRRHYVRYAGASSKLALRDRKEWAQGGLGRDFGRNSLTGADRLMLLANWREAGKYRQGDLIGCMGMAGDWRGFFRELEPASGFWRLSAPTWRMAPV